MIFSSTYRQCPHCGSTAVRSSQVHPWSESMGKRIWLTVTLQRPYRCLDCDERFFDLRFKKRVDFFRHAA